MAVSQIVPLYPENDLALTVKLYDVTSPTGARTVLTGASVSAFLSTGNLPTSTVAGSLNGTVVETGTGTGVYLVTFDRSVLTAASLASNFASATPYLIIDQANGVRAYVEMAYTVSRPATVV